MTIHQYWVTHFFIEPLVTMLCGSSFYFNRFHHTVVHSYKVTCWLCVSLSRSTLSDVLLVFCHRRVWFVNITGIAKTTDHISHLHSYSLCLGSILNIYQPTPTLSFQKGRRFYPMATHGRSPALLPQLLLRGSRPAFCPLHLSMMASETYIWGSGQDLTRSGTVNKWFHLIKL